MEKENNKFHALQLFTDTISAETVHLTNEAVGIYIRLICFNWTKNTKPFSQKDAYRICQCRSKECEDIVDLVLKEFFLLNSTGYTHKRLKAEHIYLTSKYKKKSDAGKRGMEIRYGSVTNKTITPIPSPIPIPKKNIQSMFEEFWSLLTIKKGSKHLCSKKYALNCLGEDPRVIAESFNRYSSKVKDKEFVAHVSTWINQRRFEDEENNKPPVVKPIIYTFKNKTLKTVGETGHYIDLIDDNGNKYQKHKFKKEEVKKI